MSDHSKGGKAPNKGEGTGTEVQWAELGLLPVSTLPEIPSCFTVITH